MLKKLKKFVIITAVIIGLFELVAYARVRWTFDVDMTNHDIINVNLISENVTITGGTIDGTVIGGTTPAVGSFTEANIDNITIDGATITSDTGAIGFGNEDLTTTGTITGTNVDATTSYTFPDDTTTNTAPVRSATLVAAASDSSDKSKAQADYVCNGTADDVEIQAAIDALPAGGGKVLLLEGTYNINDTINLVENLMFQGNGFSTIITTTNAISLISAVGSGAEVDWYENISVCDLSIVGNDTADADKCGVYFELTKNCILENLDIQLSSDSGIMFTGGTRNSIFKCHSHHNKAHGIRFAMNTNGIISGNHLNDNGETGIRITYGSNDTTVSSNVIEANALHGISCAYNNERITFTGNILRGNTYDGIVVPSNNAPHAAPIECIFSNNMFYNNGRSGINFSTGTNKPSKCSVVGNVFVDQDTDATSHGVLVVSGVTDITIVDNLFYSNYYGIHIVGDRCIIANNWLEAQTASGIYVESDYNILSSNICISNSHGILLEGANYNAISSNQCRSNGAGGDGIRIRADSDNNTLIGNTCTGPTQKYGIHIYDNTCNDNIVRSNILKNNDTEEFHNIGTATIFSNQYSDHFQDCVALSTNYVHAAITGTGAEQEITTNITNPDVPRNISITNSANSTGIVTITGIDAKGNSITEDITIVTGGNAYGVKAFATVSKITIPATVVNPDTIAVGISDKLGLSNIVYETGNVYKVKVNNTDKTGEFSMAADVNVTNDTIDMSSLAAGVIAADDDITIWFRSNLNIID